MKKTLVRGICLISALVMLLGAAGCSLIEYDEEKYRAKPVATVGGLEITRGEFLDMYDMYKQYYGITEEVEQDAEMAGQIKEFKLQLLDMMVREKSAEAKAKAEGFLDYTDEDRAKAKADVAEIVDPLREEALGRYTEQAKEDSTIDPQAKADEEVQMYLTYYYGFESIEKMEEQYLYSNAMTRFRDSVTQDAAPDEAAVKAEYDKRVGEKQAAYETTPAAYSTDVTSGSPVVYRPAGYRYVKHILIKLPDAEYDFEATRSQAAAAQSELGTLQSTLTEKQTQAATLEKEVSEAADETAKADKQKQLDELKAEIADLNKQIADKQAVADELTAKADEQRETALEEIRAKAQQVLDKAKAPGADFDALIEEYGEDTGMQAEPAKTEGYLMNKDTSFMKEFLDAGMALAKVGDITGLVATDYGYHIIKYESSVEEGAVPFEEVKQALTDELTETARTDKFETLKDGWVEELKPKTYENRL